MTIISAFIDSEISTTANRVPCSWLRLHSMSKVSFSLGPLPSRHEFIHRFEDAPETLANLVSCRNTGHRFYPEQKKREVSIDTSSALNTAMLSTGHRPHSPGRPVPGLSPPVIVDNISLGVYRTVFPGVVVVVVLKLTRVIKSSVFTGQRLQSIWGGGIPPPGKKTQTKPKVVV